jgi:uncharacterized protein
MAVSRFTSLKHSLLFFALLIFFLAAISPAQAERPFPKPEGLVNDFAGVISPTYRKKIAALTGALLQKTGVPIVVVTMPDIGGAEYNDYANRLYSAWGIGKKGEDKGVLIFVAVKERKMRIETGYGVEGILPDGLVGEIRDRYMVPLLKQNKFGEGLYAGAAAVARVIAKASGIKLSVQAPKNPPRNGPGFHFCPYFYTDHHYADIQKSWRFLALFSALFLLVPAAADMDMDRGRYSGGGHGGSFGGFGGGFGGFGGGMSGGGGAGGGF